MSIINTNVISLNAQRNLATNSASLSTTIQRLSSGLRINSAKDDAAGLAISERFTTQIRGLNQASRNANDGISLAQTAEGALGEISNNLQRIRELSVQSRNATNSADDRAALQKEVAQLKSEIDRVADQTSFNGLKLLDGSFTAQAFQVGADQGQTISVNAIVDANINALGSWTSVAAPSAPVTGVAPSPAGTPATPSSLALGAFTSGSLDASDDRYVLTFTSGSDVLEVVEQNLTFFSVIGSDVADAFVAAGFAADGSGTVNGFSLDLGGQSTIENAILAGSLSVERDDLAAFTFGETITNAGGGAPNPPLSTPTFATAPASASAGTPAVAGAFADVNFQINGTSISVTAAGDATAQAEAVRAAINAQTSTTGVAASIVSGAITLTSVSGSGNINVAAGTSDATAILANTGLTVADSLATPGSAQTGFSSLDISTVTGADNAILAMDAALNAVNGARADLGAIQNRFQSVISNLNTTSENLAASRSRIRDTDYAKETAELTRSQILQQAGTAMLAQANQVPQNVLSLLR